MSKYAILLFKRVATKDDSPSAGFVYEHHFGTGHQELIFPTHVEAALFEKHEKLRLQAIENSSSIFDLWPEIDCFYVTSDGRAYIRAEEARANMLILYDKWHIEINKDEFGGTILCSNTLN